MNKKCAFGHSITEDCHSIHYPNEPPISYSCGCSDATGYIKETVIHQVQKNSFDVFVKAELDRQWDLQSYVERFVASRESRGLYDDKTISEIFDIIQKEKNNVLLDIKKRIEQKSIELFGNGAQTLSKIKENHEDYARLNREIEAVMKNK